MASVTVPGACRPTEVHHNKSRLLELLEHENQRIRDALTWTFSHEQGGQHGSPLTMPRREGEPSEPSKPVPTIGGSAR